MEENRYLSEYEVESIACIPEDIEQVILNHPSNGYKIELRNKKVELGDEFTILTAYVIYMATSLDEAVEIGENYIKEFADYLTFSTGIKFKVAHRLKVIDWTKGVEDRQCYLFDRFPGDDRPYPLLDQKIIDTIETVLEAELSPVLKRVLRWFSRGVSSHYLDDQYQCFWFSIELLASVYKGTEKVNDMCAKCRTPLYCEHCGTHPMHKPYTKQAIQHLFGIMISDDPDKAFKELNGIRNSLMHGDDIKLIEKNENIDFSEYVDKLGNLVWVSIFNTIMNSYKEKKMVKLSLLQPSTYCMRTMVVKSHISYGCRNPDDPRVEDIPTVEVSAIYDPE